MRHPAKDQTIKDSVCGMRIENPQFNFVYEGKKYNFCSQGCLKRFKKNPRSYSQRRSYDLIIIGGGPAGLTAGVYASILKIGTLLLSSDIGGQAVDSTKIKNYMGFDLITGPELLTKFQDQLLHHHYVDHRIATVVSVRKSKKAFLVKILSGEEYRSLAVIIATGMVRNRLNVPGEKRFTRRGICYAASQDIPLLGGKKVAVIGGGNSALQIVLELNKHGCQTVMVSLEPWTGDPSLCEEVRAAKNLEAFDHHCVLRIGGKEKIEYLLIRNLQSGRKLRLAVDAVFVAIGLAPNSSLVRRLADLNERGEIKIRPDCGTRTPGLFAAGDVTDVFAKRIVIASGEGAKAALAAHRYLSGLKE